MNQYVARAFRVATARGRRLVDLMLPPRCLGCGNAVLDPASLCAECWAGLSFIAEPHCACCGLPFGFADAMATTALCGGCMATKRPYGRARSVLTYDEASRGLILAFKHSDRTDAAPMFGRWLARAWAEILEEADYIVPVPLHRWRLFKRRYNQSALLAQATGRLSDVAYLPDLLLRARATPSQGEFGPLGRRRNVAGAFRVHPRHLGAVEGKRIVLVDDVHTTGATIEECAKVLKRAHVAEVDVLTLARVVRVDE